MKTRSLLASLSVVAGLAAVHANANEVWHPNLELRVDSEGADVTVLGSADVIDVVAVTTSPAGAASRPVPVPTSLARTDAAVGRFRHVGENESYTVDFVVFYFDFEGNLGTTEYRAHIFCEEKTCQQVTYSDYLVLTGQAQRIVQEDGTVYLVRERTQPRGQQ